MTAGFFPGRYIEHAVAQRGAFFTRVTNVVQLLIPALDVRAVRGFLAAGNGNVTILGIQR